MSPLIAYYRVSTREAFVMIFAAPAALGYHPPLASSRTIPHDGCVPSSRPWEAR